jgi:nucleotide-binding universal stress UspA family protein
MIVVGVDGSAGSAAALKWAVEDARAKAWAIRAVMCWGFISQHHAPDEPIEFDPNYDEAEAAEALESLIVDAVGRPDVEIERRVVLDLAAPGLLRASADADLLVLGARGIGGFQALLLGSTSDQCLHHSPIPVVVVRARHDAAQPDGGRVVVGIDGSEGSMRALDWAVEHATAHQLDVDILQTWNVPAVALPYIESCSPIEEAAGASVEDAVARVERAGLHGRVSGHVACGSAGSVLLHAAEDAGLVVVGSRGLTKFKELLLGSVSHRLATHARCPVAVIPPAERSGIHS